MQLVGYCIDVGTVPAGVASPSRSGGYQLRAASSVSLRKNWTGAVGPCGATGSASAITPALLRCQCQCAHWHPMPPTGSAALALAATRACSGKSTVLMVPTRHRKLEGRVTRSLSGPVYGTLSVQAESLALERTRRRQRASASNNTPSILHRCQENRLQKPHCS